MMRPLEYRVRTGRTHELNDPRSAQWSPASVGRIAEEVVTLLAQRDTGAILEVRPRRDVERPRRRRPA